MILPFVDLYLSEDICHKIAQFTKADVFCRDVKRRDAAAVINEGYVLCFSGGYDSLAANYLMPEGTKLVAIDFGKNFEREVKFFKIFNPYIIRTNFRELKLDRASWTFMGIGLILFSEVFECGYMGWGTILEAITYQLRKNPTAGREFIYEPFAIVGGRIQNLRIVSGLTEVGTAMIILQKYPQIDGKSLDSLAAEGSIKKYRKYLISKAINKKYSNGISFKKVCAPNKRLEWAEYFADDFLALWEIKNLGIEVVEKIYNRIPEKVMKFVEKHQLDFYEKYNTNFLNAIPKQIKADYSKKLAACNILPYSEFDWNEFDEVRNLLAEYHDI